MASESVPTAVVGLGLIGGSAALALGARGFDVDPATRERARSMGIDARETLREAVEGAAVVVAAVSTNATVRLLPKLAAAAQGALLTDTASLKAPVARAAAALPAGVRFVGGHPMAGSPVRGLAGARASLFSGRPWILTPTPRSDEASLSEAAALVARAGARPVVLDPARQDAAMTWISHFPHAMAAVIAVVFGARPDREAAALAGPGILDMTRLAGAPESLVLELLMASPGTLAHLLDEAAREAGELASALRRGDVEAVKAFKSRAAASRSDLDRLR